MHTMSADCVPVEGAASVSNDCLRRCTMIGPSSSSCGESENEVERDDVVRQDTGDVLPSSSSGGGTGLSAGPMHVTGHATGHGETDEAGGFFLMGCFDSV